MSKGLQWTPHPVLRIPSREQAVAMGAEKLMALHAMREELIAKEQFDPLRYGFEPEVWALCDRQLRELRALFPKGVVEMMLFGGNRASKSEWAAKRIMQMMVEKAKSRWWAFQSTQAISQQQQQPLFWKYMPPEWRSDTGKLRRGAVTNITYTQKGGFTEDTFVLPNGAQIWFKFYAIDVGTLEGPELDGAWLDELYTPEYLDACRFRCVTRNGIIIKSFTPKKGYTPAVKEELSGAKTLEEVEAELLPIYGRQLEAGHKKGTAEIANL